MKSWIQGWARALRHGTYGVGWWDESQGVWLIWPSREWYDGYWYGARLGPFYFYHHH